MPFKFFKSSTERAEEARTLSVQREAEGRLAMAKAAKAEVEADAARQRVRKAGFALEIADRASKLGPEGMALAIQIITGQKMRAPASAPTNGVGASGMDSEMRTFFWELVREQRSRDPMTEFERFAKQDELMRQRYGGTVVEAPDTDDRLIQLANSAAGVKLVEVGGPAVLTLLERLAAGISQQPIEQPRQTASITEVGQAGGTGGLPDPRKPLTTNEVIALLEHQTPETMAGLFVQRAQHDETLRSLLQLLLETPDAEIEGATIGWLAKNPAWTPVLRWLKAHDQQRASLVTEVKRLVYASGAQSPEPAPATTNGHTPQATSLRNF